MQPKNLSNGAHLHNMEILSRISINPKCEADLSDLGLLSVHIQKRQIQKCFLMNELNSNYGFAIWSCFWIDGGINYLAITILTFWFTIKIRCHSGTIIWFTIASAINFHMWALHFNYFEPPVGLSWRGFWQREFRE